MPITPNVIWECLKNVLFTSADPMQDISERLEREKKEFINCMFYVSLFLSSQKKIPLVQKIATNYNLQYTEKFRVTPQAI